ncbi:bifunctional hydroxymethylpyrimidine kinase/phosphomethylpyrimidine kinase [Halomonas sp. E19]|uniref:bifunctional hydroxymethylpyrimidine kinase/phosphomethylpyrimidine kinase n=1 Tax=Halomonas sp. E19 TaxID=3397247 RepID=UPI004033CC4D
MALDAGASNHPPVVLVLAGHDPTGGAGLVADSEAIAACGGWALTVPTALTVQNCRDVQRVQAVTPELIREMAAALNDFPVTAIKVGLLTHPETLEAVAEIIGAFPGVPVVVDPVLKAGGRELSTAALLEAFRRRLLPLVDILTPNRQELMRLAGVAGGDDSARAAVLLEQGCGGVLVTGTDTPGSEVPAESVEHALYGQGEVRRWRWPRLPGSYHGSGCTLAAALAARLAAGESLSEACAQAQAFTWQALEAGWQPGRDQALPRRGLAPRAA